MRKTGIIVVAFRQQAGIWPDRSLVLRKQHEGMGVP
jgi:hypothetical protein